MSFVDRQIPVWTWSAKAPETAKGTRQRFKAIGVSRNIRSCFAGNFGGTEELTGRLTGLALTGFGTRVLDVKTNLAVAVVGSILLPRLKQPLTTEPPIVVGDPELTVRGLPCDGR